MRLRRAVRASAVGAEGEEGVAPLGLKRELLECSSVQDRAVPEKALARE